MGVLAVLLAGCRDGADVPGGGGTDTDGGTGDGPDEGSSSSGGEDTGSGPPAPLSGVGPMGMRRLTRYEYDNTIRDLVGDDTPRASLLPEDKLTPFDNDYTIQTASAPLIEGAELLSKEIAQDVVADFDLRANVVGCSPAGPTDEDCMRSFVADFGRKVLRRPLRPSEVDDFVALGLEYAAEDTFYTGVEVILRAFLQHAEFLYRVERGEPVEDRDGMFRLDDFELATRMSYLLWSSTPDDALLDAAEAGELADPQSRAMIAREMLDDPRARVQVDRFHALWLGYSALPHAAALSQPMREETAALIERVVFDDDASWLGLFTATETWVSDTLAEHYGMPAPAGGQGWVDYGTSGRQGLLSHASFLSVAANPGETSPTKRGKMIRTRLMCEEVPPPPPDLNVDEPPDDTVAECRYDQYEIHRSNGACRACHETMDPIGFGLENYDRAGVWRAHDEGKPQCLIAGDGEIVGVGTFNGPAELSDLLIEENVLPDCATQQLFRYMLGRETVGDDGSFVADAAAGFVDGDLNFADLLVDLVRHDAFGFRLEEQD